MQYFSYFNIIVSIYSENLLYNICFTCDINPVGGYKDRQALFVFVLNLKFQASKNFYDMAVIYFLPDKPVNVAVT